MTAFRDELEKLSQEAQQQPAGMPRWKKALILGGLGAAGLGGAAAIAPGVIHGVSGGLRTTGRLLRSPASAKSVMQQGWRSMSNVNPRAIENLQGSRTIPLVGRKKTQEEILKSQGHLVRKGSGGGLEAQKQVGLREAYRQGGGRGVAEELSRSGWTGAGPRTKYMPLGMKSWMVGLPAALAPSSLKKGDPEFTGMGRAERAGKAVGETAGYIAGWPIGMTLGAAASKKMVEEAGKRGRFAKYMARGRSGLVPVLAGSAITGAAGAYAGRMLGRPVDLATGERQQAKARKGLKNYLQYRHGQIVRDQRRAAGVSAY